MTRTLLASLGCATLAARFERVAAGSTREDKRLLVVRLHCWQLVPRVQSQRDLAVLRADRERSKVA